MHAIPPHQIQQLQAAACSSPEVSAHVPCMFTHVPTLPCHPIASNLPAALLLQHLMVVTTQYLALKPDTLQLGGIYYSHMVTMATRDHQHLFVHLIWPWKPETTNTCSPDHGNCRPSSLFTRARPQNRTPT